MWYHPHAPRALCEASDTEGMDVDSEIRDKVDSDDQLSDTNSDSFHSVTRLIH